MKTNRFIHAAFAVIAASTVQAGNPPAAKVLEAQRRMDATARGSRQRVDALRALEKRTQAAAAAKQQAAPKAGAVKK